MAINVQENDVFTHEFSKSPCKGRETPPPPPHTFSRSVLHNIINVKITNGILTNNWNFKDQFLNVEMRKFSKLARTHIYFLAVFR